MLFGDVSAYIPQVGVISTSLGTFPRPVPRPLPGVTLPASPECPTPLCRGWLWGWLVVVEGMDVGWSMMCSTRVFDVVGVIAGRGVGRRAGRRRCCWRGLRWCSTLCAWLLAEVWVVTCPVRAPCPALPNRLRRSVFRHSLGAGCWVVVALLANGRCRCRWRGSYGCSRLWS